MLYQFKVAMRFLNHKYKLCIDDYKMYRPNIIRDYYYMKQYPKQYRDFILSFLAYKM